MRDYLTQVVLNLVLNAVDATDDQGRIHVAATDEDGWLVLSVEDDGRGISLADRCRLFQPFFTTKAHGTGLGLFVSRQILEDFAGTLALPFRARRRARRSSSGCRSSRATDRETARRVGIDRRLSQRRSPPPIAAPSAAAARACRGDRARDERSDAAR